MIWLELMAVALACDPALDPVPLADCLAGYEGEPTPDQAAAWALKLGTTEPDAAEEFATIALAGVLDPATREALVAVCPECTRTCPVETPLDREEVQCLYWQADPEAGQLLLVDARRHAPHAWHERATSHVDRVPTDAVVLYQLTMHAVANNDPNAVLVWGGMALQQCDNFPEEVRARRIQVLVDQQAQAADAVYLDALAARGAEDPRTVELRTQRDLLVRRRDALAD
jgi:hypothetical protein